MPCQSCDRRLPHGNSRHAPRIDIGTSPEARVIDLNHSTGVSFLNHMAWIAVDWGTSNLRAWAMDSDGQVIAEASSGKGMAKLNRDGFEPALLELINDWLMEDRQTPVIACGMVGARQGWIEAAYRQTPCRPVLSETVASTVPPDPQLQGTVLPGVH